MSFMDTKYRKQPVRQAQKPQGRSCDHPACTRKGEYRAPRSRGSNTYYWFCLDHVRDYNRSWDFYKGMTTFEIECHLRDDVVWRRPTWPLNFRGYRFYETVMLLRNVSLFKTVCPRTSARKHLKIETPEDRAIRAMELQPPVTKTMVQARYKELVKRFHPDVHGGDRTREEKLKVIIEAYKTLMKSLRA